MDYDGESGIIWGRARMESQIGAESTMLMDGNMVGRLLSCCIGNAGCGGVRVA